MVSLTSYSGQGEELDFFGFEAIPENAGQGQVNCEESGSPVQSTPDMYTDTTPDQTPSVSIDLLNISSEVNVEYDANNNANEYKCDHCDKSFIARSTLKCHSKVHIGTGTQCPSCPKVYHTPYSLKQHITSHTCVVYGCKSCDKTYKTMNGLNAHKREHKNLFKYFCDICGKGFNFKTSFEGHKAKHDQSKPFVCTSCNKGFQNMSNLSRHSTTCGKKDKPYPCEICGSKFKCSRYWKDHIRTHDTSNPEKYQCAECGSFFKYKASFYKHCKNSGHR